MDIIILAESMHEMEWSATVLKIDISIYKIFPQCNKHHIPSPSFSSVSWRSGYIWYLSTSKVNIGGLYNWISHSPAVGDPIGHRSGIEGAGSRQSYHLHSRANRTAFHSPTAFYDAFPPQVSKTLSFITRPSIAVGWTWLKSKYLYCPDSV